MEATIKHNIYSLVVDRTKDEFSNFFVPNNSASINLPSFGLGYHTKIVHNIDKERSETIFSFEKVSYEVFLKKKEFNNDLVLYFTEEGYTKAKDEINNVIGVLPIIMICKTDKEVEDDKAEITKVMNDKSDLELFLQEAMIEIKERNKELVEEAFLKGTMMSACLMVIPYKGD